MSSQSSSTIVPSPEKMQNKFDLAIALTLSAWPSLTLAVQNLWGGPDSSEKRDWFAGAVSDLLVATPDADVDYVEEFLLQVMNDEFDVNVEDDSGAEVAAKIMKLRQLIQQGDFDMVDEMYREWAERESKGSSNLNFKLVDRKEEDDETSNEDEDEVMEDVEVPSLVRVDGTSRAHKPEIDEDGFTQVISKKRR